jgi:hypothetical protein
MVLGRMLGSLLLLAALAVLVRDLLAWGDTHIFVPIALGELLSELRGSGLANARGAVEATAPWLWNWILGPILALWAALTLAIAGCALLWLGRANGRRHRNRSRR